MKVSGRPSLSKSREAKPAGPMITDSTGLDGLRKLLEADSATTSANTVGSPPTANAKLIASGTITTVAPTWLITRSEEHTSELQTLMRISYAVFCLKKNKQ